MNIPNGLNPHKLIRHNDSDDHDDLREQVPTYYGTQKETGKIILENMAYGLESPRFMDVKIGARTVSQSELMAAGKGASDAWKKKQRLKLADWIRNAQKRGFTIVAATGFADVGRNRITWIQPEEIFRTYFGKATEITLSMQRALRQSASMQIENIIQSVDWSSYAMVAASVLFVTGKDTRPDRKRDAAYPWVCRVRVIDFAHSYYQQELGGWGAAGFEKYSRNFIEGLQALHAAILPPGG